MPSIKKVDLLIEGMHCNSCASGIQLVLEQTPGVISASASYSGKKGSVEFDEEKVKLPSLIGAIEQLGYKATETK